MKVEFDNEDLDRLAFDPVFAGKWSWDIKRRYQKAVVVLQAISRRESLFPMSGLNFERLSGKRPRHRSKKVKKEYSIRLNKRWRVVLTFVEDANDAVSGERILILDVEDYHR